MVTYYTVSNRLTRRSQVKGLKNKLKDMKYENSLLVNSIQKILLEINNLEKSGWINENGNS